MSRYPPSSPTLDVPYEYTHHRGTSSSTSRTAPTSPRSRSSLPTAASAAQSSITMPESPRRGGDVRAAKGGLPLPSGAKRGGGGNAVGFLGGRLRSGRTSWVVLAVLMVGVWAWRSRAEGGRTESISQTPNTALFKQVAKPTTAVAAVIVEPLPPPSRIPPPAPPPAYGRRPVARPAAAKPAPPPPDPHDSSPLDISVRPHPFASSSLPISSTTTERFLAYSPHSGYHNQRISLENALTLAFLLKRTLLVPPVWFGHAIPYISFDKLQRRLEMASKEGLEHCVPFGEGSASDPVPRECNGFWDWTVVDWSFLVDLSSVEKLVSLKSRSNLSAAWIEDELALRPPTKRGGTSPDAYYLRDETMYQYRFYDSKEDDEPLDKWGNRVDLDTFRAETEPYKLLHVGTLFGTSRLRTTLEENYDARSVFRKAMVFRTEIVDEVTEQVRELLGGEGAYYGLHLRVGDGVFQKEARGNMRGVWEKLCREKMKLEESVCDEMRERSEEKVKERRDWVVAVEEEEGSDEEEEEDAALVDASTASLVKRANSRPQREGAFKHAPLPPLPVIRTLSDSPLSSSLSCHAPLHTASHLLPFNAPLFIATDSKLPSHDANLALFFSAFPCAFVLGDFGHLPALGKMNRMRNEEDKTPLAGFLYPQLDAQIAAWGRGLVGTPQSTYSRFATDVLHQVYHGWEIVERG